MPEHTHAERTLTEADKEVLVEAFSKAFEKSAPVLAGAIIEAGQQHVNEYVGKGVLGWLMKLLFMAGIAVAVGFNIKTGGH